MDKEVGVNGEVGVNREEAVNKVGVNRDHPNPLSQLPSGSIPDVMLEQGTCDVKIITGGGGGGGGQKSAKNW